MVTSFNYKDEKNPFSKTQVENSEGNTVSNGLYHFGQRYYDPTTGRWTQQDPEDQLGSTAAGGCVAGDAVATVQYDLGEVSGAFAGAAQEVSDAADAVEGLFD